MIPTGAQVDLTFSWQGKTVRSPVYVHSGESGDGEPHLFGTNVKIPLGLMTPASSVEAKGQGSLELRASNSCAVSTRSTCPGRL